MKVKALLVGMTVTAVVMLWGCGTPMDPMQGVQNVKTLFMTPEQQAEQMMEDNEKYKKMWEGVEKRHQEKMKSEGREDPPAQEQSVDQRVQDAIEDAQKRYRERKEDGKKTNAPKIERVKIGDNKLTCNEIKTEYDALKGTLQQVSLGQQVHADEAKARRERLAELFEKKGCQ